MAKKKAQQRSNGGATRRRIVTFVEEETPPERAAEILGRNRSEVTDGVESLGAAETEEAMALCFTEFGATTCDLNDDDAAWLQRDRRVAEVVDDFDVYPLAAGDDETGASDPAYLAGYRQAVRDLWALQQGETARAERAARSGEVTPSWFSWLPWSPSPQPDQTTPWHTTMVKANRVWDRVTGRGAKVAILDTGVDEEHPDLSVCGGRSFVPGVGSWQDDVGHGTHCAGIVGARNNRAGVVGVAPEALLYAGKVLGQRGGKVSWILAGMGWAAREGMDVVSMSLGSTAEKDASCTMAYQRAAEKINRQGGFVVAAAGNSGDKERPWVNQPARCSAFMAVAAVDRDKKLADFSSRGPASLPERGGVEIAAPGVTVRSTYPGGEYKELSGTSMACPHVSAAAALLKEQHPSWSPEKIRERLKRSAEDLGKPGDDPRVGSGLLNCEKAVFG